MNGAERASVVTAAFQKFICRACGWIYDEAAGDADGGLPPGTRYADIPDDWRCPLCGVGKADFEPYDDAPVRPATRRALRPAAANRRALRSVVIVGAGRAGWQMAEALRQRDAAMPITLVTACDGDLYDKPLLSVAYGRRLPTTRLVKEAAAAAAERLALRLLPRTVAVHIDAATRTLRTSRGPIGYAHLVLAHGAAPRAAPQLPPALCWRINHLDAYRRLRSALDEIRAATATTQRVLIVGAGLVGCELADDLATAGHPVTLLDPQPRPLASLLSVEQSAALTAAWSALPLTFVGGVQVQQVTSDGALRRVTTTCGRSFDAEQVIAAIGLQTPSRLAASAGLAWRDGIAVDAVTLATSAPDIHALGDCITVDGQAQRYIEPIARQAAVIADAITGAPARAYAHRQPPVRVKTGALGFTVIPAPR